MPTLSDAIKAAQQNRSPVVPTETTEILSNTPKPAKAKIAPKFDTSQSAASNAIDHLNDTDRLMPSAVSARQVMINRPHLIIKNHTR